MIFFLNRLINCIDLKKLKATVEISKKQPDSGEHPLKTERDLFQYPVILPNFGNERKSVIIISLQRLKKKKIRFYKFIRSLLVRPVAKIP